jgi:hypothetical protein
MGLLPFEGDLLKTFHLTLKENKHQLYSCTRNFPPGLEGMTHPQAIISVGSEGHWGLFCPVTFLGHHPPPFIYPLSIGCCGLHLSCLGSPPQDHFSTINPVLVSPHLLILCLFRSNSFFCFVKVGVYF